MIILIQALVIMVAFVILMSVLAGKQTHVAKAWKKIALCALVMLMIVAVLFPELTNVAAHAVGVGRGADLLLYVLTLAFIWYAVNDYIKQQQQQETIHRLARRLALREAHDRK